MLRQGTTGSVKIRLTEAQRKMVVRSLATTMENMRRGVDGANRKVRDGRGSLAIRAGAVQVSQHLPARAQEQSRAKCRAERTAR